MDIADVTYVDRASTASEISRRSLLRRAAAAGMTLPAVGLLAACGSSGGGGTGTTADTVSGTVRVIKGPFFPKTSQDTRLLTQLSRPFARRFPDVDVQFTYYDWANYQTTLTTQFAGNNPPDLPYLTTAVWPLFASKGALADLTDRVTAPDLRSDYDHIVPSLWDGGTYEDKIYAVPWVGGTFPVFANRTLLEQAGVDPDTWNQSYDTMRAAAKAMTSGDVKGFAMGGTSFKTFSYQFWLPFVWGAGGDVFNADKTGGDLDNDGTAEAWDFLASMYKDGFANPGAQYDLNGQQALFTAGRTGILSINSYVIQSLLTDRSVRFDWSVYEPPPGAAGASPLPLDYGYLTMAAKAKAQDATWEYIRFLSSRQAVTAYADGFGPTLLTARDDTHVRGTDDPHYQALFELTARARPYTADPKGVDVLHAACDEFELCVSGEKSASQATKDANDKIDQLLAS